MRDQHHQECLAEQFEAARPHLRGVAFRMLGSLTEAEDALQETWLRLSRAESAEVANPRGWLTTVVSRICLDQLRSRAARREESLDVDPPPLPLPAQDAESDPEQEAILAESVGLALLAVLNTLTPAERLAFVLHDLFGVTFDEIAPIVDRSPVAVRQLASRARRRVRGSATESGEQHDHQREIVAAFLAASRGGDFDALLALLDPDAVCRADAAAVVMGAPREVRGARAVAGHFRGRARDARLARVDGVVGAAWAHDGALRVLFQFSTARGHILAIDLVADPARLQTAEVVVLDVGRDPGHDALAPGAR